MKLKAFSDPILRVRIILLDYSIVYLKVIVVLHPFFAYNAPTPAPTPPRDFTMMRSCPLTSGKKIGSSFFFLFFF